MPQNFWPIFGIAVACLAFGCFLIFVVKPDFTMHAALLRTRDYQIRMETSPAMKREKANAKLMGGTHEYAEAQAASAKSSLWWGGALIVSAILLLPFALVLQPKPVTAKPERKSQPTQPAKTVPKSTAPSPKW